jgi:ATP-dependent RNA helicase DeaD
VLSTFSDLGLSAPLLDAITSLGFETPTEIQEKAIPHLLGGHADFIGLAQTGTGKTAAFGLPLLDLLDPEADFTQAIVLAPTRELGQQIAEQLALFSKKQKSIRTLAVYGGANIAMQIKALKKTRHVVIATPGRLIDLVKRKAIHLEQVRYVVLDEADEMLNMGFKEELDTILGFTPEEKQTWLFSATMPKEIRRMVKDYMTDPFEVRIDPKTVVNTNIQHQYAVVHPKDKAEALTRFLDLDPELYGVVFCRTKMDTQRLAEDLVKAGYRADAIHGDLSQAARDRVMKRFKQRDLQVLIATDVAARGIDVNDLSHVFHFALPNDQAYYTHRSGRTARAGKKGISMSLIGFKEKYKIHNLEKGLGVEFARVDVPMADAVVETRLRSWAMGLMAEAEGAAPPQELVDQIDLLLSPLSKEDMIARLVARELGRLNLGHRADLNDRGPKGKKGFKKDGQNFKGGNSAGGFKKPFKKGGYKKDGYSKDGYKKGGYQKSKPGGYKKKPVWDDDGFASPSGDGEWTPREGSGGYRKSYSGGAKKGGYKKGKPGGFNKGPGGPNKGGYKKRW